MLSTDDVNKSIISEGCRASSNPEPKGDIIISASKKARMEQEIIEKNEKKKQEEDLAERFLKNKSENADLNQYWYSKHTIDVICKSIVDGLELAKERSGNENYIGKAAFLSTPSLYYSLPQEIQESCYLFDYDKTWQSDRGFVFYDFEDPLSFDSSLMNSFDIVVIDPPFISHSVWRKYSQTANALLKWKVPLGKESLFGMVLATTVQENIELMQELFGVHIAKFKPFIPNLVYQYSVFVNFESEHLNERNHEVWEPEDE